MDIHTIAITAVTIDLEGSQNRFRGILLFVVSMVLLWLTIKGLLSHGKRGDYSGAFSMVGAVLLCMIPLALAAGSGAVALGYGQGLLRFLTGLLS